jgi:hypothetical protein
LDQFSEVSQIFPHWRKSMIIGEKNTDLKRLTGRLKLRFLTEIGRLHWNQGEEVAHFAWFSEPSMCNLWLNLQLVEGSQYSVEWVNDCCSGERNVKIWINFQKSPRFSLTFALKSREREVKSPCFYYVWWALHNWKRLKLFIDFHSKNRATWLLSLLT